MNTSRIKHYIRALVLATFLSVIGPVGLVAEAAANIAKWRKGAEQGNAKAQSKLGLMHAKGQGVPQDY